ncbi:MAG: ImmA/IrrE family metallo-endopeptidase [Pirellulales bacterium]
MLPEITSEELDTGLDAVVDQVLIAAGVAAPPVDAVAVARALGIVVAIDDYQQGRARCVRLNDAPSGHARETILLRPEPRRERRQWAVAHEIGEVSAGRVFAALGVDPREAPTEARERVANQLAGRLLLPGRWFAADAPACGWDLLLLKRRYRTASHELIARRMLEFSPAVIITVFDHGRIFLRRSNLPGRVPPLLPAERQCWRHAHELNRAKRAAKDACAVQAWPIHEEGWKREILRTAIDEEYSYVAP